MPGDRDAGASDGGGFDMLPQREGGVVEVALFQQRVQGLRGAGIGGGSGACGGGEGGVLWSSGVPKNEFF